MGINSKDNRIMELFRSRILIIAIAFFMTVSMMTCAPAKAADDDEVQAAATEASEQIEEPADVIEGDQHPNDAVTDDSNDDEKTAEEAADTNTANVSKAASAATGAGKAAVKKSKKDKKYTIQAPDAVDNVVAKAIGRGKIRIKWTKVKDADGYYIYRATKKNGKYRKIKKIRGNKTKYIHIFRTPRKNKSYYFKVYAYKTVKGELLLSDNSDKDPAKNTISYKKRYTMKATAYSGGGLCANGKRCKVGRVAVDPDVIPLGTWLYVKGYGFCQACDTGGAIQGNRIDLYYNSESQCNRYGVRYTKVYVLRK